MNASLRIAVVSLSLLGLAACAGAQTKSAGLEPAPPQYTAASASHHQSEREERYVAAVERVARRRGIGVVWVNPPRYSQAATQAQTPK